MNFFPPNKIQNKNHLTQKLHLVIPILGKYCFQTKFAMTYLDKVSCDDCQLSLRTWQPNGFNDEIASGQLRMQHQVVRDGACTAKC